MARKAAVRKDFHTTVQFEMNRQGMGFRTLAKKLAGDGASHEQIEVERRTVRRWLKGATPSQRNRRRVAVALGLPEETFDDEEDSLATFLQKQIAVATSKWERKQERVA